MNPSLPHDGPAAVTPPARPRPAAERCLPWSPASQAARSGAFTLIELLVTMAVLSLFVVLLFSVTDSAFKLWRSTAADITMFEAARSAYDTMTRRLSQATLNTYLDYYTTGWARRTPGDADFIPGKYGRASDLAFYSGEADSLGLPGGTKQGHGVYFFAPLGYTAANASLSDLQNLLNPLGYHVEWGSDASLRPSFLAPLPASHRFRLVETILPSQHFNGYPDFTDPTKKMNVLNGQWVVNTLGGNQAQRNVLAENIILLAIRPEITTEDAKLLFGSSGKPWDLTKDYFYDSLAGEARTTSPEDVQFAQLPPMLRVAMIAVAEKDAARLIGNGSSIPPAFQTQPSWFTDPANFEQDLEAFSQQLAGAGVRFRVFNQVIPIRGAKFSAQKEQ